MIILNEVEWKGRNISIMHLICHLMNHHLHIFSTWKFIFNFCYDSVEMFNTLSNSVWFFYSLFLHSLYKVNLKPNVWLTKGDEFLIKIYNWIKFWYCSENWRSWVWIPLSPSKQFCQQTENASLKPSCHIPFPLTFSAF